MVEGELTHTDSMGHSEVLKAGEVQRMSAGTGIVHSEMNHSDAPCRLLQIWIEPEETAIQPAYDQRSFVVNRDWTPLICPESIESTMTIAANLQLLRAKPQPEDKLSVPKILDKHQWIQVIEGTLELINNDCSIRILRRGDGLGFNSNHADFQITSKSKDSDILMFTML
jgi:redox-sensitive bicupin YhaK (pirin superfamily)